MMTPLDIAHAARDAMWANDQASRGLGMVVLAVAPGQATVRMVVLASMLNGQGHCHGGFISTLADSAFAFACNSYNEITVASGFDVSFLAPARLGDELTASAVEVSRAGRTGLYDVTVHNAAGVVVAVLRGRAYAAKGKALVPGVPVGKTAA
jgi:acyl-CoA thioesterase